MVGGATTCASPANVTIPTRNFGGRSLRKLRTAAWAAPILVGATSSARIEPELSIASTTVACSRCTVTFTCGRASATPSTLSASRNSAGGTQRRQPPPPTTVSSTPRFGKASA